MINANDTGPGFLRILVAEADEVDAFVIKCELSKLDSTYTLMRVSTSKEYLRQLDSFKPDLVIANYACGGQGTLESARSRSPKIPFIYIVPGSETTRIPELIALGASDALSRKSLPQLVPAVERAIQAANANSARTEKREETAEAKQSKPARKGESLLERIQRIKDRLAGKAEEPVISSSVPAASVAWDNRVTALQRSSEADQSPRNTAAAEQATELKNLARAAIAVADRGGCEVARSSASIAPAELPSRTASVLACSTALEARCPELCENAAVELPTRDTILRKNEKEEIRNLNARVETLLAERDDQLRRYRELEFSIEQRVAERTAEFQAANAELRLLAERLQNTREEERKKLHRMIRETIEDQVRRLRTDMRWVHRRLSRKEGEISRKQMLEAFSCLKDTAENTSASVNEVLRELANW